MRLKEAVELLNGKILKEGVDFEIRHVTSDSREVKENTVFVCIEGTKLDGHDFAVDAVEKGALAIVCEKPVSIEEDQVSVVQVENSKKAYALLSAAFFGFPSKGIKLAGVTGTNGKTTTTFMLHSIFENAGKRGGLIGTVANKIGAKTLPVRHTTPEPFELQSLLKMMLDEGVEFAAMEVSSHAIDQERIAGTYFDVLVFTNLSQDHLDYHLSMDEYARVKSKLFFENTDLPWVVNSDDLTGKKIAEYGKRNGARVLTYGLESEADIYAYNIQRFKNSLKFNLKFNNIGEFEVKIPVLGSFNVYNAMAAFGAAFLLGFTPEEIIKGLSYMPQVPGRFEVVKPDHPFTVIIDYAHTPDGLEKTIKSALELVQEGKRVITVFGCGGDRDKDKRPKMGRIAAELSSKVIITSDNPRSEDPLKIIEDILRGIREEYKHKVEVEPNRKKAIIMAVEEAKDGDIVLIAGKGHETYQIFADKIIHFDDKEVALDAIKRREKRIVSETS